MREIIHVYMHVCRCIFMWEREKQEPGKGSWRRPYICFWWTWYWLVLWPYHFISIIDSNGPEFRRNFFSSSLAIFIRLSPPVTFVGCGSHQQDGLGCDHRGGFCQDNLCLLFWPPQIFALDSFSAGQWVKQCGCVAWGFLNKGLNTVAESWEWRWRDDIHEIPG